MKFVTPYHKIIDEINGDAILKKIEYCARTCYDSHDKTCEGSAAKLVRALIKSGHESVLEHVSITVEFRTDRAILAELTRHRLASFSVQSQRYVKYDNVEFIIPSSIDTDMSADTYTVGDWFTNGVQEAEDSYKNGINIFKLKAQIARALLPNCTATKIVMTCNLREWRHVLNLRTDPAAHPDMVTLMIPLLEEFKSKIPVIFDDVHCE